MKGVCFRKAVNVDIEQIMTIDPLHRGEKIERAVRNGECYIAEEAAQIVGFAIMDYAFFECGFIELLIVAEDCRRRGIGESLLEHLSHCCATEKLFTSTNESNDLMRGLLIKAGFTLCGQIDALDEGDPELFYVKRKDKSDESN